MFEFILDSISKAFAVPDNRYEPLASTVHVDHILGLPFSCQQGYPTIRGRFENPLPDSSD